MSDEHWEYYWARQIYEGLLSQGQYCPEENLRIAKLNVDSTAKRLRCLDARRERRRKMIVLARMFLLAVAMAALIYAIW